MLDLNIIRSHSLFPTLIASSCGLNTLTQAQLDVWVEQARTYSQGGKLPDYIPLLALTDRTWLAVQIQTVAGQIYAAGDMSVTFPLMSVIKPFVLLFLLQQLGTVVFSRVGMLPSDEPFNSLKQLEIDRGFPRNPMINSGAIANCSLLPGADAPSRCESLRQWLNQAAECQLFLDEQMLNSVRSLPNERNRAITSLLAASGYVAPAEIALGFPQLRLHSLLYYAPRTG